MSAVTLTCDRCLGSGRLDAARLALLAVAGDLRALRIGANMSLREAATILEMSVVEVANAERGRTDPRPVLALLRERAAARLAGGPVSVQASFDAAVMGAVRLPHGARQ